ncbi:hypothetical protein DV515_00013506, partial [Chloebia gouldiae]
MGVLEDFNPSLSKQRWWIPKSCPVLGSGLNSRAMEQILSAFSSSGTIRSSSPALSPSKLRIPWTLP